MPLLARAKPPARPKAIPNNAVRRIKSPSPPVNVEMMFAHALEGYARKLAAAIHAVIAPHVAAFARPEVEHADAGPPKYEYPWWQKEPKEIVVETAVEHAHLLLKHMRAARKAGHTIFDEAAPTLRNSTQIAANRTLKHSIREFKRLDIDVRKEPALLETIMDGWRKDSVALIKNMDEHHLNKIEKILREGYGRRAENLEDDIAEVLGSTGEHYADGMLARRAKLIARDQVLSLNAKITRYRQVAAKIPGYVWTTSQDERVRPEHAALEGERFSWDGEGDPEEGHPGEAINCLPAGAKITLARGVLRVFRRWYRGELTTLVTDSGKTVQCTPNHPVLTASGWKPAHAIEVGDQIFEARQQRTHTTSELGVEDSYPSIADVFDVFSLVGNHHRVAGAGAQFHGDGSVHEQVDIVDPDGGLLLHLEASEAERLCEFVLAKPYRPTARGCSFELALQAMGLAPDGVVRRLGERLALFEARRLHTFDHGGAASARLDVVTLQEVRDRLALNPIALGQELDRGTLSIDVEAFLLRECFRIVRGAVVPEGLYAPSSECLGEIVDAAIKLGRDLTEEHPALEKPLRIVKKSSREFEGHVFNLETRSGWYGADTVLQSNCRCVAYPILTNEFLD